MSSNSIINKYDVAIIIVNFRTHELVVNCLKSLVDEIKNIYACVVLIDNHSCDDSIEKIMYDVAGIFENDTLKIIHSSCNGGFSAGNNIGIKSVEADYYLLLNSDTILRKGALKILLDTIKTNPKIGILSPRLEWDDTSPQKSCFNYHTPISELVSAAKTSYITQFFKRYTVAQPVSETLRSYEWVSFACVLINAKVIDQIGLMDEGYFMYYEDVEFCHRAHQSDWLIQYQPSAHVVHFRGGTATVKLLVQLRKKLPLFYYESRTRFFYQLYGYRGLFIANLLWSLGAFIASLRSLVSSTYTPDIVENQWRDVWTNFFRPLSPYTHPDDYDKT